VAILAAALLGTGTVFVLEALHHKGTTPVSAATIGPTAAPEPMASGSHKARAAGNRHHAGSDNGGTVGGSPQPSPAASQAGSGTGSGSQPSGNPQPTPTRHSHTPTPPPSSPPASPGTLAISPGPVTLTSSGGVYTGSFTLTAQGGPVSGFTILDPAPPGDLSISPSTAALQDGQTVTITVTVTSSAGLAFETDLTVDPGGLTIAIDYPPAG